MDGNLVMNSAALIGQLAKMTSERDAEVLELHLLRAMHDVLAFDEVALLRTHPADGSRTLTIFSDSRPSQAMELAAGGEGAGSAPAGIAAEHWNAIVEAVQSDRIVSIPDRGAFTTVYPLRGKGAAFGHLLLRGADAKVHRNEPRSIEDVLRIFYNYYALLEENQHDKLTGLLNRKTFDERIGKLLALASAYPEPRIENDRRRPPPLGEAKSWLAVVDIDHFKRINDGYGHLFGDEVLLLLAQLMRRSFRRGDLLFRFGGEEFVIVLAAPEQADAYGALEKFRRIVADYRFPQVGQITVSLGATEVAGRLVQSDLVGRADQALYHAKRCGRNRLYFYEDLVAGGEIVPPVQQGTVEMF